MKPMARAIRAALQAARQSGRTPEEGARAAARAGIKMAQLSDAGPDPILPFDAAIKAAKERGVVLPDVYYGELRDQARITAFSIAGETRLAQLEHTLGELQRVMEDGGTLRDFRRRVNAGEISLDLPQHRIENILRTNTQGALARGRCVHHTRHRETRPFLRYSAVNDSRTRASHAAQHGRVEPQDSPFWSQWTPPCGFQCRCTVTSLTRRQAEHHQARDEARATTDIVAARAAATPDAGWEYSPCEEPDAAQAQALQRHGANMPTPIAEQAREMHRAAARRMADAAIRDPEEAREIDHRWGEMTDEERRNHNDAFAVAPDHIKERVRNTPGLGEVRQGAAGEEHYSYQNNYIDMAQSAFGDGAYRAVWRHEYGHHYDFTNGRTIIGTRHPVSTEAIYEIARDRRRIHARQKKAGGRKSVQRIEDRLMERQIEDADKGQAEFKRRYEALGLDYNPIERAILAATGEESFMVEGGHTKAANILRAAVARLEVEDLKGTLSVVGKTLETMKRDSAQPISALRDEARFAWVNLSDFVGAVSNNTAGYGHSVSYYEERPMAINKEGRVNKKPAITSGHTTEAMANYFTLEGLPDQLREGYIEFARHMAPHTYKKLGEL